MNDQVKGPEIPHQPIVFDDYREIKWLAFKMLGSCLIFSFVFILVNFLPTTSGEWWGGLTWDKIKGGLIFIGLFGIGLLLVCNLNEFNPPTKKELFFTAVLFASAMFIIWHFGLFDLFVWWVLGFLCLVIGLALFFCIASVS